jgi:hypothetical protein
MVDWYYLLIVGAAAYTAGAVFGLPRLSFKKDDQ